MNKELVITQIRDWMDKNAQNHERIELNIFTKIRQNWWGKIHYIERDPQCYDDKDHLIVVHSTPYCMDTWSSIRQVSLEGLTKILNILTTKSNENI